MDKIIEILNTVKPEIDFLKEDNLIEDEILTSFDIVTLVALLKTELNIDLTVKDVIPENFKNAKTIFAMVQRLK